MKKLIQPKAPKTIKLVKATIKNLAVKTGIRAGGASIAVYLCYM